MKSSPSSSEGALTSLKLDLPLNRQTVTGPTVESFLAHLGDPGRFQLVVMVLLASNSIPVVVNHLLMAFYAVTAPHNCRMSEDFIGNKSSILPLKSNSNSSTSFEQCEMYLDPNDHSQGTQQCIYGYEFHHDDKEWNVVSEWGLVCDRAFIAPLITTIYFCGVMIGGLIVGSLSDRFGRKNMMLVCLYTQCLIGIGIYFVRRLMVFVGLRFIQGILIQGLQCVTYSLLMELFKLEYRTLAGCVIEAFWAVGIILLALIAKYVQHWRYIQLATNIPTLATIFYIWIIPESVRWLLSRGKLKRAEEIVIKIASYNSLRFDRAWLRSELNEISRNLKQQQSDKGDPNIMDIVKNSGIRKHAFVMFYIWIAVALSYYGISFSIPNLSGDRYLNFMIGAGIEMAAYLLTYHVLGGFGRKYPLMIYLFLSGILCILSVSIKFVIPENYIDVPSLTIGLALVGKAAVVSCFCSIFIYSNEIFPTVIRTVGVGTCTFFGRIGSLLAPQILFLGHYVYEESPELLAFLTFGSMCILAGFLTLLLPETLHTALPDTVVQANDLGEETHRNRSSGSLLRRGSSNRRSGSVKDADEIGYGKSPEWVEVDGMIVSRGVFESRSNTLGLNSRDHMTGTLGHGSTLSLPYSSRTILTNSSRSTYDNPQSKSNHQQRGEVDEEPPYETLPNIELTREEYDEKLRKERMKEEERFFQSQTVQIHNSVRMQQNNNVQDDSVISGHFKSGVYDFIQKSSPIKTFPPENPILRTKEELKNHMLLSAELGDETRL